MKELYIFITLIVLVIFYFSNCITMFNIENLRNDLKFTQNFTDRHSHNWKKISKKFIGKPNVKMLELGTFEARSSKYFLDHILTGKNSNIVTVDVKPDITKYSKDNIKIMDASYSNFEFVKENFITFLAKEIADNKKYDIIYQDGGKISLTTLYQLICSYYLLKSGGILIIDDYEWVNKNNNKNFKRNNDDTPKKAVDTFIEFVKNDITILHKGYQFILKKN